MQTDPEDIQLHAKKRLENSTFVIGMCVAGVILIVGVPLWIATKEEDKKLQVRAAPSSVTAPTNVRPQMQTFHATAPVGKLSDPIPALPRHCLDWSPAPPYTVEDVAVFVKGKRTETADIPEGGLVVQGAYLQFQSNLEEPVPLNMVRWPMRDRKC